MRQGTFEVFSSIEIKERKTFNAFERLVIQHAQPAKLISHSMGGMWAVYFLWHHQWGMSLIVGLALGFLGVFLARNADPEQLLKTPIGKWFYVMLNPINLFFQLVGYTVIFYGVWQHDTATILQGVTALMIGNLFGWDRLKKFES